MVIKGLTEQGRKDPVQAMMAIMECSYMSLQGVRRLYCSAQAGEVCEVEVFDDLTDAEFRLRQYFEFQQGEREG